MVPSLSGLAGLQEALEKIEVQLDLYFWCASQSHFISIHTFKMNATREELASNPGITCVEMIGPVSDETHPSQAVALYILVDRSGSMASKNKLRNVLLSLEQLLTYLNAGDFLTVLDFDDTVKTVVERESCDVSNKVIIQQRLSALVPGGGTDLGLVIRAANEAMAVPLPYRPSGIKKACLLLTDGEATTGETRSDKLVELQQAILSAHPDADLSAIGYGDDHKADLLRSLALSGTYSIVRSGEDVAAVFGDILGGLRTVTAQAVKVIVPPHVTQKTTLKLSVRADGFKEILIGNIIASGKQMVVLEGLLSTDPLRLEYTRVSDATAVVLENVVVTPPSISGQETGRLALLRCEVVGVLDQAQHHLTSGSTVVDVSLLEKILMLQATLRTLTEDSIQAMLLRELDRAHSYLTMPPLPPMLSRHYSNMLSQHTQVLGTARGIMSVEEEDDDPGRNVSVFASAVQRATSSGMSSAVRAVSQGGNPHALHISPMPSLDPASTFPPPPSVAPLYRS
jgi:hypothetical protein